jgi:hypothetical protein
MVTRVKGFTAGQIGTIWVSVVAFAALAFWQYGAMPDHDGRLAAFPNERVIAAQRSLADARRDESASKAQAESTMAMMGRLQSANETGFGILNNTYKTENAIHRADSTRLAFRELSLRAAEDRHREEIERRGIWTQTLQYGLLTMLVVVVVSAIAATFVWFGNPLDA